MNNRSRDKCMRTAGYIWTDYKTNKQIAKELKITRILDKVLEYNRNWIQHVNRMPRNRLPRVMKHYSSTGRRNYGRALKRLLDTWDRNGSTSGPTLWQIHDNLGAQTMPWRLVRWCMCDSVILQERQAVPLYNIWKGIHRRSTVQQTRARCYTAKENINSKQLVSQ